MSKFVLHLSILVAVCISLLPVHATTQAQPPEWAVYYYNGATREIIRINSEGVQTNYIMHLNETDMVTSNVVVRANKAAYCVIDRENPEPGTSLFIQDLFIDQLVVLEVLGERSCNISAESFSVDGSQFAFGLLDQTGENWELRVINSNTGETLHSLTTLPEKLEGPYMPDVRYHTEGISFAMLPWFTGGVSGAVPAFIWSLAANQVVAAERWGHNGSAHFALTDEIAWVDYDENRPAVTPNGPMPTTNVVRLNDPNNPISSEIEIFHSADAMPINVVFTHDGGALAILLFTTDEPALDGGAAPSKWIMFDRGGNVSDLSGLLNAYSDVAPIPHGYVLNSFVPNADGTGTTTLSFNGGNTIFDLNIPSSQPLSFVGYDGSLYGSTAFSNFMPLP